MNRQMLPISVVATLLLAAVTAFGLGWPGGDSIAQENSRMEGGPVLCSDGRPVTTVFELNGSQFHVVGALVAIAGRAAVIAGPTGDVPVILGDGAEVSAGLVVGEPVDASGMLDEFGLYVAENLTALCPAAAPTDSPTATPLEPTDTPAPPAGTPTETPTPEPPPQGRFGTCNRGPGQAGELRLEVDEDEVEIKRGTVFAFTDGMLTVDTPGGPVTVLITSNTEIDGDLGLAAEVRVEGMFDHDGNIVAEEASALCPDAAHHARDDDDGADDDDDDGDEDQTPARATPAVPAIPAVPGEPGDPATPAVPAIPAVPPHDFDDDHEDNGSHGSSGHGGGDDDRDRDDDDDD